MTPKNECVYLDNAATSFPKPSSVTEAVHHAMLHFGAAGRGSYRLAELGDQVVDRTREALGARFHVPADRFVFCHSGTDALNLILLGFLRPNDHVVVTQGAHNSVLRPLHEVSQRTGVRVTEIRCNSLGQVDPDEVIKGVENGTRLVVMTHVSNVTGAMEPIQEVAMRLQSHSAALLVDAAQSAGHLPIDLRQLPIDFLATSGHKGLLGPLGTGIAYLREGRESEVRPLRFGGTGSASDTAVQPESMPTKYEAGNLNVPAIAGLGAGLEYLEKQGQENLRRVQANWSRRLVEALVDFPEVQLRSPVAKEQHAGPISFTVEGFDSREFATLLDSNFGLQLRAGFHCAAHIHEALNTVSTGGTIRVCPGPFTTEDHLERLVAALGAVLGR
jgi:cysteine desulfurase/selenocysteine lyase